MRWLIRRVTRKGKGSVAYEEDIHYGDTLTVGRGSDQAIFVPDLKVALEHARLTALGNGQYKVESQILAGVRVNGAATQNVNAGPGTQVEIGGTRLTLLDPSDDFDAAVEVATIDQAEKQAASEAMTLPTTLGQTWLSRRLPSWLLFAVVAGLMVLLPIAAHYSQKLAAFEAHSPLPTRNAWQAGELAPSHQFFGAQCNLCHETAFRWVRDESCGRCHAATKAHADPVRFNLPELGDARCAHCHRDHNGSEGLIIRDQILCSACHVGLQQSTGGATTLDDVRDFGDAHPQFSVNLPQWDPSGAFTPVRTSLTTPRIEEKSGLKFPHDVHLDPKGINSPGGKKVLACASCHQPDAGGAAMKPIDFEPMCQDCHRLDFDMREPERQVPHGKIAEIQFMLDEFYARRALEGGYADTGAPPTVQQRRRPGQALSKQEQAEALAWARDKSRRTGENLFTGRACTVCHTVAVRPDAENPWYVAPVRVNGIWFAKAAFTHAKHEANMKCGDCHTATDSKASSDLLIPGIDNCLQCHGGEDADDKVASTCIACHGYHDSEFQVLSELQARAREP